MNSRMYHIAEGLRVLTATRQDLTTTADTDSQGYYRSDGTNRTLCWGLMPDGEPLMWIDTNGDPVTIPSDYGDDWIAACHIMGDDDGQSTAERIAQGYRRIIEGWDAVLDSLAGMDEYGAYDDTWLPGAPQPEDIEDFQDN